VHTFLEGVISVVIVKGEEDGLVLLVMVAQRREEVYERINDLLNKEVDRGGDLRVEVEEDV
jgi:hypothetical protein